MKAKSTAKKRAARVLEIIVGVVFLLAAWGKMTDVASFGELIVKYGLPFFSILAPAIVALEILCGLMLVFRLWPRLTATVTALMLVAFTAAFFYANHFNGVADCGCFGSLGPSAPAWMTYSRNGLLLVLCILVILWESKEKQDGAALRWGCVAVIMVAAAFFIGFSFRVPSYYSSRLVKKHPLLERTMAETTIDRFITTSPDSTYILYIFSYSCTSCIDGLNNVKQYDDRELCDHFYGLPVTNDRDSILHKAFDIHFDEVFVGDSLQGIVKQLPTLLFIENNTVKYVIEGSVPSAFIFRRYYTEQ